MVRRLAALGAASMLLVLVAAPTAQATFPDRNGRIAFQAETDAGIQILTIRPNGHDLRQVTEIDGDATTPDWSPDGTRLAFSWNECHIGFVDADGSDLVVLPNVPAAGDPSVQVCETDPSYLPDGARVVYERYDPTIDDDAVWVMNVDGSQRRRIVGGGAADPNVSPDGGSVTFKSGDIGALYIARLDGSGYHQISPELNVSFKHDWAPDGNRIAFSDKADALPGESVNIATMNRDGSDVRYVTHETGGRRAVLGGYSPDGQWLVFRLVDGDPIGLFRVRPDGSDVHEIAPVAKLGGLIPRNIDWGPPSH